MDAHEHKKMMDSISDFYVGLFKDCSIKYEAWGKYKTIETFDMLHKSSLLLVLGALQTGEIYKGLLNAVGYHKNIMNHMRDNDTGIDFPKKLQEHEKLAMTSIEKDLREIKKIEL